MVSGQFTPFLNTIWRHVAIEGESATPAVDWAKADSQLPEGANARASLKQCELSAETWGTAALDQSASDRGIIWPGLPPGKRAGLSTTVTIKNC
jgi:hypothetical protein